ncbi:MAG TPA: pyruvate kinase [Planctomycetota bacterium]|nr:pyruvate kinase [Planctomycetota bacterium]
MQQRRTKIVATIGPATWERPRLEEILRAGVDIVRLNFSHANREKFAEIAAAVRDIAPSLGRPVAVLADLQGPKIRTGKLKDGKPVMLVPGAECTITTDHTDGTAERLGTTYANLPADVRAGQRILLADGTKALEVISSTGTEVRCRVIVGGLLAEHQGINLPGTDVSAPSLTEKDVDDLDFALSLKVDFIALSFVRRPEDVSALRRRIHDRGADVPIIAKIEKPEALEHIEAIVDETDAIMVARGDLGVEMPAEQVPVEQKKLIERCNFAGKPVITATQMLESMVGSPQPTRAEASDVANAIFDGTDAVMLSAETSIGKYPVDAVKMMAKIALAVEQASYDECRRDNQGGWQLNYDLVVPGLRRPGESDIGAAVADAAVSAAQRLCASEIAVFTISGATAMKVAKRRPAAIIYALTPTAETYNRLALVWGVHPVQMALCEQTDRMLAQGEELLLQKGMVQKGDVVVIVSGAMPVRGATNLVEIRRLGA